MGQEKRRVEGGALKEKERTGRGVRWLGGNP